MGVLGAFGEVDDDAVRLGLLRPLHDPEEHLTGGVVAQRGEIRPDWGGPNASFTAAQ